MRPHFIFFDFLCFIQKASSALEFPRRPAQRALLLSIVALEPLDHAVKVEGVVALAPDRRAVVARKLAVGADAVKLVLANGAYFFIHLQPADRREDKYNQPCKTRLGTKNNKENLPFPNRHWPPLFYPHL